jgi:hypothetical protein
MGHGLRDKVMPVSQGSLDGNKQTPRPSLSGIAGDSGAFSCCPIIIIMKNLRSQFDREAFQ